MFCPWIFGLIFLSSHSAVSSHRPHLVYFLYSGIFMNNSRVDSELVQRYWESLQALTTFPLQVCWCVQFSVRGKHLLFFLLTAPLVLGTTLPGRSLCICAHVCAYVWHLGFCGCHPEDEPFECLPLVASGACVCRVPQSVANKETILNWLPAPRAQCKRSWEKCLLPSLPLKESYLHTIKAAAWELSFQSSHRRWWLGPSPLGHWQVLAHPQLLGAAKTQESGLDNHKGLRDNQELRMGWTIRFTSYTLETLVRLGEVAVLCRNQHRKSRKMKKQRNMFQTKEQDKTLGKDCNEREIWWFTW